MQRSPWNYPCSTYLQQGRDVTRYVTKPEKAASGKWAIIRASRRCNNVSAAFLGLLNSKGIGRREDEYTMHTRFYRLEVWKASWYSAFDLNLFTIVVIYNLYDISPKHIPSCLFRNFQMCRFLPIKWQKLMMSIKFKTIYLIFYNSNINKLMFIVKRDIIINADGGILQIDYIISK